MWRAHILHENGDWFSDKNIMLPAIQDTALPARPRVITFSSLLGVVSMTVLVDTLILTFAFVSLWALAGYFNLPLLPFAVLSLVILLPTAWACIKVGMMAFDAETDPSNN